MTLALAAAAVAFTAGCSAGQQTQTAQKVPSVPGANAQATVSPGPGSVSVRNALLSYPGPAGYQAGGSAPVEVRIFNDTPRPIRLVGVTSDSGTVVLAGGSTAGSPAPAPGSAAPASPGASPSAAPAPPGTSPGGAAVDVEIPPGGFVVLAPGQQRSLRLAGLSRTLRVGDAVGMTFRFAGNVTLSVAVPVAPPAQPAPRSPMVFEDGEEVGHG